VSHVQLDESVKSAIRYKLKYNIGPMISPSNVYTIENVYR